MCTCSTDQAKRSLLISLAFFFLIHFDHFVLTINFFKIISEVLVACRPWCLAASWRQSTIAALHLALRIRSTAAYAGGRNLTCGYETSEFRVLKKQSQFHESIVNDFSVHREQIHGGPRNPLIFVW